MGVASARVMKIATKLFVAADTDRSGHICSQEAETLVVKMRESLGEAPLSPQALAAEQREVLKRFDANSDGQISKAEFFEMLCADPWRQMLPEDSRDAFAAAVKAGGTQHETLKP